LEKDELSVAVANNSKEHDDLKLGFSIDSKTKMSRTSEEIKVKVGRGGNVFMRREE
jgi:hypothetical protein